VLLVGPVGARVCGVGMIVGVNVGGDVVGPGDGEKVAAVGGGEMVGTLVGGDETVGVGVGSLVLSYRSACWIMS